MTEAPALTDCDVVTTEPFRIAFPSLFKPSPKFRGDANSALVYQLALLVPPDKDIKPFQQAVIAAMRKEWNEVFGLSGTSNPLAKMDSKAGTYEGYEVGGHSIACRSGYAPSVIDGNGKDLLQLPDMCGEQQRLQLIASAEKKVPPGSWCRVHIRAYAWDKAGRRGVSFSLEAVQVVDTSQPFAGTRPDARRVFGVAEDTSDPTAEQPAGGDDISALFG